MVSISSYKEERKENHWCINLPSLNLLKKKKIELTSHWLSACNLLLLNNKHFILAYVCTENGEKQVNEFKTPPSCVGYKM